MRVRRTLLTIVLSTFSTLSLDSLALISNVSAELNNREESTQPQSTVIVVHLGGSYIDVRLPSSAHAILKDKLYVTEKVAPGVISIFAASIRGLAQEIVYSDGTYVTYTNAHEVLSDPVLTFENGPWGGTLNSVRTFPFVGFVITTPDRKPSVAAHRGTLRPVEINYHVFDYALNGRLDVVTADGGTHHIGARVKGTGVELRLLSGPEATRALSKAKRLDARFLLGTTSAGKVNYEPVGEFVVDKVTPVCGSLSVTFGVFECQEWTLMKDKNEHSKFFAAPQR